MTSSSRSHQLVVGTRGSLLARAQTQWVVDRIRAAHPDLEVRTEIIKTTGDRLQDRPLPEIGGKGLFTEQLEEALLAGEIDVAVHSAKDLPTDLADGLDVISWPRREDPRDAWISSDGTPFDQIADDAIVGTSSLRRQALLRIHRPGLRFVALRGNIDTRINKVHRGECAGALLAMAGLKRAGLDGHVTHPFDPDICLPAPGQGALALEGRRDDQSIIELVQAVYDAATATAVRCERAILGRLDAGCRAPVAILAGVEGGMLRCRATVVDPSGRPAVHTEHTGAIDDIDQIVDSVVTTLCDAGAVAIIAACRRE